MKTRLIFAACAACLVAPLHAEEHTKLGGQMEQFNDAYKALRKETDPAKAASITREAQQAVAKGLAELPAMVTKMPDGPEKDKAAATYRKMMGEMFVTLCDLEALYLDGKIDEAGTVIRDLRSVKKKGHDQFIEE